MIRENLTPEEALRWIAKDCTEMGDLNREVFIHCLDVLAKALAIELTVAMVSEDRFSYDTIHLG